MADSTIGALPAVSELSDASLLVVEQSGSAQKLTGAQIKAFAVAAAEAEAEKAASSANAAEASATDAAKSAAAVEASKEGMDEKVTAAAKSAEAAAGSASSATVAKTAAQAAQTAAETAKEDAVSAKSAAESAKTAAQTAKTGADSAKTAAETARDAAKSAQTAAASSASTASTKATAAAQSASSASSAKTAAESAKTEAQTARDAIVNMIVEAVTLASGKSATVEKSLVDSVYKLTFGLPRGDDAPTITNIAVRQSDYHLIVTLSDGKSYDAGYCRGAAGQGSGDMAAATYDPQGMAQDVFAYVDDKIADIPTPDVSAQISAHNTSTEAHSDIREAVSSAATAASNAQSTANSKLGTSGNGSNVTAAFTAATTRANIATGEKLSVLFGKIAKWFADLGTLAFKSSVAKSDLAGDVQTSLGLADTALQSAPVTSVNGKTGAVTVSVPAAATATPLMDGTASVGSGTAYALGNHRHPTDTSRVPTSRTVNGKALSANITLGAVYTATLLASEWEQTSVTGWTSQTVTVSGLKATYNAAPFVDVSLSGTDATGDAELSAAWMAISATAIADTAANSITVKFPGNVESPAVNIPIRITVYD